MPFRSSPSLRVTFTTGSLIAILAMTAMGVGVIGWLWITVMAFSERETLWGIGCLIISPVNIIYGLLNFQELKIPLLMVCGGAILRIAFSVYVLSVT